MRDPGGGGGGHEEEGRGSERRCGRDDWGEALARARARGAGAGTGTGVGAGARAGDGFAGGRTGEKRESGTQHRTTAADAGATAGAGWRGLLRLSGPGARPRRQAEGRAGAGPGLRGSRVAPSPALAVAAAFVLGDSKVKN